MFIDSFKEHVNDLFQHTAFRGRDKENVDRVLSAKHHNSEIRILPKYDKLSVEQIDVTTDKVTLFYGTDSVEMNFEWKVNPNTFVLKKVY